MQAAVRKGRSSINLTQQWKQDSLSQAVNGNVLVRM